MKLKFLDLYLDAKNYIEGLDIISNIMTNQKMPHFNQSSVWIIMLINNQIFYYYHNTKTFFLRLVLFDYIVIFLIIFNRHLCHFLIVLPIVV